MEELLELKKEIEDRLKYDDVIADMRDLLKIAEESNILIIWSLDYQYIQFSGIIEDEIEPMYSDTIYIDKRIGRNNYYLLLESNIDSLSEELYYTPSDLVEELLREHFKKLIKLDVEFKGDNNKEGWFFKISGPYELKYETIDIFNDKKLICKGLIVQLKKD